MFGVCLFGSVSLYVLRRKYHHKRMLFLCCVPPYGLGRIVYGILLLLLLFVQDILCVYQGLVGHFTFIYIGGQILI